MNAQDLQVGGCYTLHGMRAYYTGKSHLQFHFTLMTPRGQVDINLGAKQINRELR